MVDRCHTYTCGLLSWKTYHSYYRREKRETEFSQIALITPTLPAQYLVTTQRWLLWWEESQQVDVSTIRRFLLFGIILYYFWNTFLLITLFIYNYIFNWCFAMLFFLIFSWYFLIISLSVDFVKAMPIGKSCHLTTVKRRRNSRIHIGPATSWNNTLHCCRRIAVGTTWF